MKVKLNESFDRISVSILPETKQYIRVNFSRSGVTMRIKLDVKYNELKNKAKKVFDEIWISNKNKRESCAISKKLENAWKELV